MASSSSTSASIPAGWQTFVPPHHVAANDSAFQRALTGHVDLGTTFDLAQKTIDSANLTHAGKMRATFEGLPVDFNPLASTAPTIPVSPNKPTAPLGRAAFSEKTHRTKPLFLPKEEAYRAIGQGNHFVRFLTKFFSRAIQGFKCLGLVLRWSVLKLWRAGVFCVRQGGNLLKWMMTRRPQPLTLPGKMTAENPGWKVQVQQLAFELEELKASLPSLNVSFPLRFALEVTFTDGEKTQVVSSTLLIQNRSQWRNMGSFADDLLAQVKQVREIEKKVTDAYVMRTSCAIVSEDQTNQTASIYWKANCYSCETTQDSLSQEIAYRQGVKLASVPTELAKIEGLTKSAAWVGGSSLAPRPVATYFSDGKEIILLKPPS